MTRYFLKFKTINTTEKFFILIYEKLNEKKYVDVIYDERYIELMTDDENNIKELDLILTNICCGNNKYKINSFKFDKFVDGQFKEYGSKRW